MKRFGKIMAAALCLCFTAFAFAACGHGMNGTYKYNTIVDVEYGDAVLKMPYFYELTVQDDAYDMIMCVDISGGFATCVGWSGKVSVDGTTVKCEAAEKFYSYQATIVDGAPVIDKSTKEEADPSKGTGTAASYILDKTNSTFKPVE